ncbi:protein of unknown function DUF437 [Staphylothermus marinus F1]|uniref:ASCH domain-containing protein n=1 Tax=Staphylothermus marinus (strain ATCC 43588 / DSM 3639 / JCM 9404 / F1) TaxID=399550 RepID=A3DN68_STAMF|nr:ASCH domain-containing protein [Staphylothermus marinus]ABN70078.1 protein of unknown function DUF437 [Staphylothermus marinus F1]
MTTRGSKKFIGRHLMVKGKYINDILSGRKKATIRRGIVKPRYKEIIVHGAGRPIAKISVEKVYYKRLYELTDEDAVKDGFSSRRELIDELKKVYPDIKDDEWVTIIEFKVVQRLDHLETEDPYLGLEPADIARIALRYLENELDEKDKEILLDLTRTGSIRSTTVRLFGTIDKRYVVRKVLRKALNKLVEKGIIKVRKGK